MLLILFFCGLLPFTLAFPWWNKAPIYSDELARTKMLPLAAAAYSNWPQECLKNRFEDASLQSQVNVTCGPFGNNDICSGFTAVIHGDQAIVISFRGTDTFLQLLAEADYSAFHEKVPWIAGGYVSKYFYDGFMGLWNAGMGKDFNALQTQYPSYKVWVTGHSLGAALASLAASYIVASNGVPSSSVQLVTFGQPRVGDTLFAWAHNLQMSYSFRVTHYRDIVPHVPPELFEMYYHHKSEAFYLQSMAVGANYTVCYADESLRCSDGLLDTTSIKDHLHYFEVDVSKYGKAGCNTPMDSTDAVLKV
nr:Lipase domain containing protein [Haemonchus contortus]